MLARLACEGARVYMLVVSDGRAGSGQQGHIPRPDGTPIGDALATVREDEARCAAQALGIQPAILLGFPEGKLGDSAGDRSLIYRSRCRDHVGTRRRSGPSGSEDLAAVKRAMACHRTQFTHEEVERVTSAARVSNKAMPLVPAFPGAAARELFE